VDHVDLTAQVQRILRELGLPHSFLEPVQSFSNGVWLTAEHVVHYHVIGPVGRLEHEARVAKRLPPEALYPEVVAVGRDADHDWLVCKRAPGVALSAAWPWLGLHERRTAIDQLSAALRSVHHSPATDLLPPCLQGGAPVLTRRALADRLRSLGVAPSLELFLATDDRPSVMAHGDFNFNQAIWHEGRVTALFDLEMSHAEAPDWDLAPFLGFCQNPARAVPEYLEVASRPEDYLDAPLWLREAYPEMFAYPRLRDRLALHELVFRSAELIAAPSRCAEIVEAAVDQASALVKLLR